MWARSTRSEGCSSVGRAAVSKTVGRGFKSFEGVAGAYIAFDCDVLDPGQIDCFMPEPDGISLDQGVAVVEQVASRTTVLGMGLTGLVESPENPARLRRLLDAAGLG